MPLNVVPPLPTVNVSLTTKPKLMVHASVVPFIGPLS